MLIKHLIKCSALLLLLGCSKSDDSQFSNPAHLTIQEKTGFTITINESSEPDCIQFASSGIECFKINDTLTIGAENGTYSVTIRLITDSLKTDTTYLIGGSKEFANLYDQYGNQIGTMEAFQIYFDSLDGKTISGGFSGNLYGALNCPPATALEGIFSNLPVYDPYGSP